MIPYILLFLIPCIFSALNIKVKTKNGNKKIAIPIFFLIFFLILAFRNEEVGIDLINYKYYFEKISSYSSKELFQNMLFSINNIDIEPLYILYNWIVSKIYNNFQFFLAITAFITVYPIYKLYNEDDKFDCLKLILFMSITCFTMFFSGLRQIIAISISIYAYKSVRENKLIKFLCIVLLASLFHQSALILLLMYPIYHIKIDRKKYIYSIAIILTIFIFRRSIFSLILPFLGKKYSKNIITETGAYSTYILLVIFYLFIILVGKKDEKNKEILGLRNFLIISIVIQGFASLNDIAMRMNYYYLIYIPILICRTLSNSEKKLQQVVKIAYIVMTIFFITYYYYSAFNGSDILNVYPWKSCFIKII